MDIQPQRLAAHLKEGLRAAYLVSGDEPLLVLEAGDLLRAAAREAGYTEREVFHAGKGFDWNAVLLAADSPSLFGARKIIEIQLPDGNPYADGARALERLLDAPPPDTVLMMFSAKLNKTQKKSKWHAAFAAAGVCVEARQVDAARLPAWVAARLREAGLQADADAARALAELVEGNLLAADQEIKRLALLFSEKTLTVEDVLASVGDSSRHGVFEFVNAAMDGKAEKMSRMLGHVRAQGNDAAMVSWAVAGRARLLLAVAEVLAQGRPPLQALREMRVWYGQDAIIAAARRHKPRYWRQCLLRCGRVDRMIKTGAPGEPWDEFLRLGIMMAR